MEDNETSGKDIEVAELLKICWLEIGGAIRTINLSPGTLYEIVFILMKRNNDSQFNLDLTIKPQHSKALKRSESLEDKPLNNWFEVLVGEFMLSAQYVGYMEFSLGQYDGDWKHGLVVKCAIIRPKK
ncbi:lectin-like [Rhododendron vialii]|uniref:lectin-like n=1 Tax=Rhododendron vialii TaxID=182163 RepID=UPI00265F8323|nr:lectin-like [Rhododendron vialii]